jgi:NAD(P)-dependent dehydrogenase (short-subunit alcohol dehydrogenase family)
MNIIVNGGTRGIGREVALYLAQDRNNQIVVTGRNLEALGKLASESKHGNISSIEVDLSVIDSQAVSFRDQVYNRFSLVDILINSAGSLTNSEFMKFTNQEARYIMETNFFGPATMIRLLKPLMISGSHIVNIASMGGFQGSSKYRGLSYYSCSKAALACLTECLSEEFRQDGIIVNCLALGSVQTEMFSEAFPGVRAAVDAKEIGEFIGDFAIRGRQFINGKIIPVASNNP